MPRHTVAVTDQLFPSMDDEARMFREMDTELVIGQCKREDANTTEYCIDEVGTSTCCWSTAAPRPPGSFPEVTWDRRRRRFPPSSAGSGRSWTGSLFGLAKCRRAH